MTAGFGVAQIGCSDGGVSTFPIASSTLQTSAAGALWGKRNGSRPECGHRPPSLTTEASRRSFGLIPAQQSGPQLAADPGEPEDAPLPPDAVVDLAAARSYAGVDEVLTNLDSELVGLAPVKARIAEIAALLLVDRMGERYGISAPQPTLHMCVTGNPGTGKTTVGLRMGGLLHKLGYPRRGRRRSKSLLQVMENNRDDLSADGRAALHEYLKRRIEQRWFANARSVSNAMERARLRHARRLVTDADPR